MAEAKKTDVLASFVHVTKKNGEVVVLEPGQKVPAFAKDQVTNPAAFADAEADEQTEESGGDPQGYAALDLDALQAALKERELPQDGTEAELVARLEADDAEKAAATS